MCKYLHRSGTRAVNTTKHKAYLRPRTKAKSDIVLPLAQFNYDSILYYPTLNIIYLHREMGPCSLTLSHMHTLSHAHAHTLSHARCECSMHPRTHTHTRTHSYTHTHTHTHTHIIVSTAATGCTGNGSHGTGKNPGGVSSYPGGISSISALRFHTQRVCSAVGINHKG